MVPANFTPNALDARLKVASSIKAQNQAINLAKVSALKRLIDHLIVVSSNLGERGEEWTVKMNIDSKSHGALVTKQM